MHYVGVGKLLEEAVGTLSTTIVRVVQLGRDDPVPTELLEVDHEGVPATAHLLGVLGAVHADHPSCASVRIVS